jgi:hypothetical protein
MAQIFEIPRRKYLFVYIDFRKCRQRNFPEIFHHTFIKICLRFHMKLLNNIFWIFSTLFNSLNSRLRKSMLNRHAVRGWKHLTPKTLLINYCNCGLLHFLWLNYSSVKSSTFSLPQNYQHHHKFVLKLSSGCMRSEGSYLNLFLFDYIRTIWTNRPIMASASTICKNVNNLIFYNEIALYKLA